MHWPTGAAKLYRVLDEFFDVGEEVDVDVDGSQDDPDDDGARKDISSRDIEKAERSGKSPADARLFGAQEPFSNGLTYDTEKALTARPSLLGVVCPRHGSFFIAYTSSSILIWQCTVCLIRYEIYVC